MEKARELQKNFCFTDYAKAFDCVDHNKLWTILKEKGLSTHLTSLLRNLCAGQEATVRTKHGTMNYFKIEKGVHQGCRLSPCLFICRVYHAKGHTEWIPSWNQIARRNINNLKYTDDITLMAEKEQEVKSILMRV